MDILVGILGLMIATMITLMLAIRRPALTRILWIALLLRITAALIHAFVAPLPDGTSDAVGYELQAWEWGQNGFSPALGYFGEKGYSWYYANVAALVYSVFGRSPLLLQSFSVLAGVLAVFWSWKLASEIWGDQAVARRAALLTALFPTLVMYSALTMREAFIVLLLVMAFFYVVRWANTGKLSFAFLALALLFMQVFLHGGIAVAGVLFLVIVVVYSMRQFIRRLRVRALNVKSFMVIVGALMIIIILGRQLLSIGLPYLGSVDSLFDSGMYIVRAFEIGGADYPLWLLPKSALDQFLVAPIRAVYFLFAPFPWDITKASYLFGLFDGLIYLFLAYYMFKNRKTIWQNRSTRVLFLILCCLVIVYAFGTNNFGTGLRHRAKFVVLMIALSAPMIPRRSFRLRM